MKSASAQELQVGRRVLIVDDDRLCRTVLADQLGEAGFAVFAAASLAAAVQTLAQQSFDLVVVDLRLGDGNGIDLVRAANALHPAPVTIVVSASEAINDRVLALHEGASDYVAKPVAPEELIARAELRLQLRHRLNEAERVRDEIVRRSLRQDSSGMPDYEAARGRAERTWDQAVLADAPLATVALHIVPIRVGGTVVDAREFDDVFAHVHAALDECAGPHDVVFRAGDYDVLWVIPGADHTLAAMRAWNLASGLRHRTIATGTGAVRLVVSLGVASSDDDDASAIDDLIAKARARARARRRAGAANSERFPTVHAPTTRHVA